MNYFIVKDSLEETLVGRDYPQAYDFIKGYNEEAPDSLLSLYDYWDSFPNYIPNLDGVKLAGCAKLTDFVSDGFGSRMQIVSPKAKLTLEQFNLCAHKFYPLGLIKEKSSMNIFYFLMEKVVLNMWIIKKLHSVHLIMQMIPIQKNFTYNPRKNIGKKEINSNKTIFLET